MHIQRNTTKKLSIVFIAMFFIISLQSQMNNTATLQGENVEELLIGKWYGGGEDDGDDEKGYMVFDEEGGAVFIVGGETIGGAGFEMEGVPVQLSYEVNEDTSPAHLDFVFSMSDMEVGRMKAIITFSDDDTFRINMSSEPGTARPTSFDSGDVASFERITK